MESVQDQFLKFFSQVIEPCFSTLDILYQIPDSRVTLGFLTEINRGLNYAWLFWTVLYTLSQEQKFFY